jgi:hypothetical protein
MENQTKVEIWRKLIEQIENTKDFVLEQTPEVIQQVLRYEKVSSYLTAALMALLLCAAMCVGYYFWKHPKLDVHGSWELVTYLGIIGPCMTFLPVFAQLCCSIDQLVKIYTAPKYFLIQLIVSLNKLNG